MPVLIRTEISRDVTSLPRSMGIRSGLSLFVEPLKHVLPVPSCLKVVGGLIHTLSSYGGSVLFTIISKYRSNKHSQQPSNYLSNSII
ncbi:hypothetical protein PISMIDRAFT_551202 [Pisolithus microcarpus 441]|uniref:Uncharacterized protein n=1 Tax=Pisolithus microcarpus 441 TaxID=765257 RepID=A0A0C9ZRN0_9AGAM|nr:hypothetical protein PISMIDRAFT_551202 [Pisolithus microcarpus 441]